MRDVEDGVRNEVLFANENAYPKFKKYLDIAFAEPGYWIAHLQSYCKTEILMSNFDEESYQHILEVANRYMAGYLSHFSSPKRNRNGNQHHRETPTKKPLGSREKVYKILKKST